MLRPTCRSFHAVVAVLAPLALAGLSLLPLEAQAPAHPLAQKLVASAQAQHPDVTEVGILLPTANGCTSIASTDKGDVGEKCESDDMQPLKTGKPSVAKEADGYDVSLLLHDAQGRRVGVVGIEMKLAGHTRASALREAGQIEQAMAAQIPSKSSLAAH